MNKEKSNHPADERLPHEFDNGKKEPSAPLLNDRDFWRFIAVMKKYPRFIKTKMLISKLSKQPEEVILGFEETLSYKLFLLDTPQHAYADNENEYLSPDLFLYARCAVVARGKKYYDMILNDPGRFDMELDFEELLEVAPEAFEKKTKEEFHCLTKYDYETYSNEQAWSEHEG